MKVEVEDLGVRYGRQIALDRVSLAAMPGEILGVLGPNGSGKSSLVKAIAGVLPHRGTVRFDGEAQRPAVIGYMPQDHHSRAVAFGPHAAQDGQAVKLGQVQVKDHQVELFGRNQCLGCFAVVHTVDRMARRNEKRQKRLGQWQIVFDQQQSHEAPRSTG